MNVYIIYTDRSISKASNLYARIFVMPLALYALTAGAFGIGVTEFVIMGLLIEVGRDLGVSIPMAGLLISGYALGVVVGAPIMTVATGRWPRKMVLLVLMGIFTIGNLACAFAPDYWSLMAARVLTAFAHGTFFGVGSVVATSLVPENKKASAISVMFAGLTVATILGVPFGTWLGQAYGWRSTFAAVTVVGLFAMAAVALLVPKIEMREEHTRLSDDLAVLMRPQVLLGLLTTILGWIGIFALFTYIAPILTRMSGFSDAAVSPILLLFGGGAIVGNLLGGRFADRWPTGSVVGTLLILAIVLGLVAVTASHQIAIVIAVTALGGAAFATAAPLQMAVLRYATGAGQSLASSFNIAAFNLGNAIGAWLGGAVIAQFGLAAVPWIAALAPLAAVLVVLGAQRLSSARPQVPVAAE